MPISSFIYCQNVICYLFSLTLTHEETKEKKYEIELSWITKENDYVHKLVPRELRAEAERKALEEI
jgi:20S proteasome subunit alpha 7